VPTADVAPGSNGAPGSKGTPAPRSQQVATACPASQRGIWWTRRAIGLHVTLIVVVPTFLGLFFWQVQRVRQGNTLSWAYVFEWPFFTGYAVYLWWKLVHDQLDEPGHGANGEGHGANGEEHGANGEGHGANGEEHAEPDEEDEALAAYNRYLAQLHASGRRKRW